MECHSGVEGSRGSVDFENRSILRGGELLFLGDGGTGCGLYCGRKEDSLFRRFTVACT